MTDKKGFLKKSIIISIILIFSSFTLLAQSYTIDYFGIVAKEIDANMSKMTSDLYYTQLSEISNFSVSDKRSSPSLSERPAPEDFSPAALSFFTIIEKDSRTDKWNTTFVVVDKDKGEEHSKRKTYDSFYKILMEPKDVLKNTIKQLIENDSSPSEISASVAETQVASGKVVNSTEELSGTWGGEDNINKIVIMRGGRGFVIFNNGASMNITVELSIADNDRKVIITQKGGSNASFFPDLKRAAALDAAVSAAPIKWILSLIDENTLSGLKETLLPDGDSYKAGTLSVKWSRIN